MPMLAAAIAVALAIGAITICAASIHRVGPRLSVQYSVAMRCTSSALPVRDNPCHAGCVTILLVALLFNAPVCASGATRRPGQRGQHRRRRFRLPPKVRR